MKVLVTGGCGFIGSHLCERLVNEGHEVICIDNLITGSLKNVEKINKNFIFINQDITTPLDKWPSKVINSKIDYILHFASPASPNDYFSLPIETLDVGSIGTKNVLELAKEKNAKFLFASTSEVYGDPLVHPQPESYWGNVNPIGKRSVYDESKRFSEALTYAYHRKYGIDIKICRIFNTYGERMRINDGRVVPTFIIQALNNEELTVHGNGKQTRSFCYISDLIDGIMKLMYSNIHEPINLGNPEEVTILDLAQLIIKLTNSKNKIVFKEGYPDDPKQRRPDITKAKTLLNWEPKVSLKEGLKKTISWFKKNLVKCILLILPYFTFSLEESILNIKEGVDAHAKGIGGAFITYSENASSTYWNPASIVKFPDTNIRFSFMYAYKQEVENYLFFSIAQKVPEKWGGVGLNYHYFTKSDKSLNIQNNIITALYSREVKPGISTGLSIKLYIQKIDNEIDFSGGIDAGALYQPEGTFFKFGLVFLDLSNEKISPTVRFGFSYPLIYDKLICSFQLDRTFNSVWEFHCGVEYKIKFLSIRIGYDYKFFSLGIGINFDKYSFDYSFTKTQEGIKYTHIVSTSIIF